MQRTVIAIAAAAATAAAAAMVVFASGVALYALILDAGLPMSAAAALVAVATGVCLLAASLFSGRPRQSAELVAAAPSNEQPVTSPMEMVGAMFRGRPLLAVGLSVAAGLLVSRQPGLIREISSFLGSQDLRR